jgi:uncharacterized protein
MTAPSARIPANANSPMYHRFASRGGEHLLVVPYSRIFDMPPELASHFSDGDPETVRLVEALGALAEGEEPLDVVPDTPPQAISLNVSSVCNLACTYCYADRGAFKGAQLDAMTPEIACDAIDRLFSAADPTRPVTVGFLGGEPFANRALIHHVVDYAQPRGAGLGLDVRFSVTTNATLLRPDDVCLLRNHGFAVTVSLDGDAAVNDVQRPARGGGGSFAALCRAIGPLLAAPGRAKVAARATVSRRDFHLRERFEAIRAVGFREVGFAPLKAGPAREAIAGSDWLHYLEALLELARAELAIALEGHSISLTNLAVALRQLHRGASAPYPCGAGGGYFSVSAQGRWYACHRAIGNPDYELGDNRGIDDERRRRFLAVHHVHTQTDCHTCWARYLCSGGCHQESSARSAASCEFVRGWLSFCLGAYCELIERHPDYFMRDPPRSVESAS